GWRQEALAENARRISDTGRELHKRLTVFSGHLGKVGRALDTSVKSYNSAVSSLESRILPSARKFENLEASEQSLTFESPNSLEITPKHTQSLEAPADDITLDLEEPPTEEVEEKASSAAGDFRAALEDS
ncbi:DNA recombination protein RmuC, partial [bacterium]|nr:DNA recombination protein RmuC [bacterium]